MALSEADRVKLLEALATNETLKATQRLRALEELGRMESRRANGAQTPEQDPEEMAPDPMADLDDEFTRYRARKRRAA